MTTARPYAPADRDACLALFDSNVPEFFTTEERPGFADWLDRAEAYRVIESEGRIVGCGGVAREADGTTASLCWGMVERGLQGQGLGRVLTEARIEAARGMEGVTAMRCDTSQKTTGFYERFGFRVTEVEPEAYGPGLDRCEMRLELY